MDVAEGALAKIDAGSTTSGQWITEKAIFIKGIEYSCRKSLFLYIKGAPTVRCSLPVVSLELDGLEGQ